MVVHFGGGGGHFFGMSTAQPRGLELIFHHGAIANREVRRRAK
jgi:hypothetical protein